MWHTAVAGLQQRFVRGSAGYMHRKHNSINVREMLRFISMTSTFSEVHGYLQACELYLTTLGAWLDMNY